MDSLFPFLVCIICWKNKSMLCNKSPCEEKPYFIRVTWYKIIWRFYHKTLYNVGVIPRKSLWTYVYRDCLSIPLLVLWV